MDSNRAFDNVIDGGARPSLGGDTIAVIDPSDGQPFASIPRGTCKPLEDS